MLFQLQNNVGIKQEKPEYLKQSVDHFVYDFSPLLNYQAKSTDHEQTDHEPTVSRHSNFVTK